MSEMENEENTGWFHCGRCGTLFSAEVGVGVPEACPECGGDPIVSHSELVFAQGAEGGDRDVESGRSFASEADALRHRSKSQRKKAKRGLLVFVLVGVCGLLAIVAIVAMVMWPRGSDSDTKNEKLGFTVATEDQRLLGDHWQEIHEMIAAFFAKAAPESRSGFVLRQSETLRRMARFQQGNPLVMVEEAPKNDFFNVIETPAGKAIESVWEAEGTQRFEAIFFEDEQGDPKIDWSNMMRYSERSWRLFLGGDGDDEGEFRLLARRRSDDESGEGRISSVVLIGPKVGDPGGIGTASPEVLVEPDSRVGRILEAAFALRDAGEGIYGSAAAKYDPSGMIRLRVRVTREGSLERRFVIREIVACHWYDFDDLGLEN